VRYYDVCPVSIAPTVLTGQKYTTSFPFKPDASIPPGGVWLFVAPLSVRIEAASWRELVKLKLSNWIVYVVLLIALVGVAWAVILFFRSIDEAAVQGRSLGIDWQQLHNGLIGGDLHYAPEIGLWNPPWSMIPLLPLGLLSMRDSWGLLVFFTLLIEIVSVPRVRPRLLYYAALFLLVLSFPSLRHAIDGNFEGLVIAGVCLCVWGFRAIVEGYTRTESGEAAPSSAPRYAILAVAAGTLLASAKPQATFLFFVVLGVYMLLSWKPRAWLTVAGIVAVVVIGALLWKGQAWLSVAFGLVERGSVVDVSLAAALTRLGLPGVLVAVGWLALLSATIWIVSGGTRWHTAVRSFSREKAGMLLAAGLLLAPYSAGNSVLSVLAVGVIPYFLKRPLVGFLLILLINSTILINRAEMINVQAYFTTAILLVCWGVLAQRVWTVERAI
jgi:hypothetical protein